MITKRCAGCKQELPLDNFYTRNDGKSSHKSRCRSCFIQSIRDIQKRKQVQAKLHKGGRCDRCGYNACLDALDFHHVGAKEHMLSHMFKRNSVQKILAEADKCRLLCANCHREIHAGLPEQSNGQGLGPCGLVPSQVQILYPALLFYGLPFRSIHSMVRPGYFITDFPVPFFPHFPDFSIFCSFLQVHVDEKRCRSMNCKEYHFQVMNVCGGSFDRFRSLYPQLWKTIAFQHETFINEGSSIRVRLD